MSEREGREGGSISHTFTFISKTPCTDVYNNFWSKTVCLTEIEKNVHALVNRLLAKNLTNNV